MRSCYSGLQSEGPPRDEHNSDTKRGVASAMKPPDNKKKRNVEAMVPDHFAYAGNLLFGAKKEIALL